MSETPQQQQPTFVLPTSTAVHRYQQMKIESILNTRYQVTDEKTPVEHCLEISKDAEATASLLALPEADHEIAVDLLEEALEGGSIDEIYGLRGGILNILLPMVHEEIDVALVAARSQAEGAPTLTQFANMPNEHFSAMTPAQVWAGAGPIEMQLADAYLPRLFEETREMTFPTPGAANGEWLTRLRLWAYNPAGGGRGRIIDLILHERNQTLARRRELAEQAGLSIDFIADD